MASSHWLYGDGGNDFLFGENGTLDQRLWGGEGHDELIGAKDTLEQYLHGGSGDDILHLNHSNREIVTAKGGKGDDTINKVTFDEESMTYSLATYVDNDGNTKTIGSNNNVKELLEGNQGDDWLFGGWNIGEDDNWDTLVIKGGSGNDSIYGGKNV